MILISACKPSQYNIQNNSFKVIIKESPHYLDTITTRDRTVYGMSIYDGDTCVIILREYPKCLLHEIRHCVEGNWHSGRDTLEDC